MADLIGKSVLIVEDEELLLELLVEEFKVSGADAYGLDNGTDAFELLKKRWFDAVITDVRMAGGDGLTLVRNINSYFQEQKPKLFLYSGLYKISAEEAKKENITSVFDKPFNLNSLIQAVTDSFFDTSFS